MILWILIFASISTHYHLNLSTKRLIFFFAKQVHRPQLRVFQEEQLQNFQPSGPNWSMTGQAMAVPRLPGRMPRCPGSPQMDLEENFQKNKTCLFLRDHFRTGEGKSSSSKHPFSRIFKGGTINLNVYIRWRFITYPQGLGPMWSQPPSQRSWWGLVFLGVHRFT